MRLAFNFEFCFFEAIVNHCYLNYDGEFEKEKCVI